jgi:hypothetical protein
MSMTPEQVQQLLQQVVQSVALQFSEYHKQQQAQQIQFQQQHQEQQSQFQQAANANKPVSSHGNRRLFDEKYFRRVHTYKGNEEGWKSWCFQFKIAVRAASPEAVKIMEWYESHEPDEEFMEEEVMEQDKVDKLDAELYETLCSMLEGEPLKAVPEVQAEDPSESLDGNDAGHGADQDQGHQVGQQGDRGMGGEAPQPREGI